MLNQAQLETLRAHILANTDADVIAALSIRNDNGMRDLYNRDSTPAFIVWRKYVTEETILKNGMDWTRVDNLTVGKTRIWEWMNKFGGFDPSKANIRAGLDECWSGTTAMLAVRDAIYVHCKRTASIFETIYATGTGSNASPGNLVVEGPLDQQDVSAAMNLP